jgi:HEAT repeat protein
VLALSGVDVEPQQVVPALVNALSDTNWFTRLMAAKGLGHLGTNAQQAAPALVPMLSDPNAMVRRGATYALKAIDPEAAAKAGVK